MVEVLYSEYDASHKGDFKFDIPEGLNSWLLLMTQTATTFNVKDKLLDCPPNTILLYRPHQKIYYKANDKRFTNDWIMFNSDELFVNETSLPQGIPMYVEDPSYMHSLFRLIAIEHEGSSEYKDAIISKLIHVIFYKLIECNEPVNQSLIVRDINELRREIIAKPELKWTLAMMAEKLNISTGYLEASYKSAFNMTCMEEVIRSRIEMAKKHLASSCLCVDEIVSLCGYRSTEHFYRQFKKYTGITPRNYRVNQASAFRHESEKFD